ncbi:MAG: hypothetical protein KF696_09760 [Planctomycetes bacterium]|nr:hypothetical protein [Planctomycetota bacterium]MCW8136142.1 hypothetical protein [Planctomycetota bacterium]
MRIALIMLAAVALGAGSLRAQDVGSQAPDIEFDWSWNLPEGVTSLSGLRGSTVLLEFFATW